MQAGSMRGLAFAAMRTTPPAGLTFEEIMAACTASGAKADWNDASKRSLLSVSGWLGAALLLCCALQ